jgi:hypothetical protein
MPNAAQLSASQRPRTVQCSATSKRTGKRCGQFVEEGHVVCRWHGGAAPRVAQAAEVRVLTARSASRSEPAPDVGDRNPFEVLIEAMRDADRVLQALKLDVEAEDGTLSPVMVEAFGQAIAGTCNDAMADATAARAGELRVAPAVQSPRHQTFAEPRISLLRDRCQPFEVPPRRAEATRQ